MDTFTPTHAAIQAATQGWLMGAALIMAIGAQNALVLRQGLRREHVVAVVMLCVVSDAALIMAGVFGLGGLIGARPGLLEAFRLGGGVFLLGYAALAARRAWIGGEGLQATDRPAPLAGVMLSCLAMTYLNPHVYLDTVVLLGSLGARFLSELRPSFAAGAILASLMWFCLIGFGAAALAPKLHQRNTWRVIDATVALLMTALGLQLLLR